VKVIAGIHHGRQDTAGPVAGISTQPLFFDIRLEKDAIFEHSLPSAHNAFAYIYEGRAELGTGTDAAELPAQTVGVLSPGDSLRIKALADHTQLILLAGKAIGEPIEQRGPFVMNTRAEIEQAIADYQNGTLATVASKGA
ncbi:MAG: hypothetical protein HKO07_05495, partial [Pseudomonadales bacterium]|nr:hypothetical protein [Pseudomonadales bacterium]